MTFAGRYLKDHLSVIFMECLFVFIFAVVFFCTISRWLQFFTRPCSVFWQGQLFWGRVCTGHTKDIKGWFIFSPLGGQRCGRFWKRIFRGKELF